MTNYQRCIHCTWRSRLCGIDDALELDIKRAVISLDASTDGNVSLRRQ